MTIVDPHILPYPLANVDGTLTDSTQVGYDSPAEGPLAPATEVEEALDIVNALLVTPLPPIEIASQTFTITAANYQDYLDRTIRLTNSNTGVVQVIRFEAIADFIATNPNRDVSFSFIVNRGGATNQRADFIPAGGQTIGGSTTQRRKEGDTITITLPSSGTNWLVTSSRLGQQLSTEVDSLETAVATLQNTAFSSGRSFIRFNDGFTIDNNNLATYEDKNIIYTAKNDKPFDNVTRPDVFLPTDADIAAAGEAYPIVFEFTHLGGTGSFTDRNVVRFFSLGEQVGSILRDQVTIVSKEAVGEDYVFTSGSFDPNDTLLPSGVFNLKLDTNITDIADIATELSGVTVIAGDAYVVETGGTWSGLTVPSGSVLVALINNASLTDSITNNDWLLLDNPRVNAKSAAFLANFNQDGIKFTGSRNVRVDPSNVLELVNMASGTPVTRELGTNSQGAGRRISYANTEIQFSDLIGGNLTVTLAINLTTTTGFQPVFTMFELEYAGGITFSFPLNNVVGDGSQITSTIQIPNIDYSSIVGQNPTLQSLYFDFFGASFFGNYTVGAVVNSSEGELNQAVAFVAAQQADIVRQELNGNIARLSDEVDNDGSTLNALTPRISNIRTEIVNTPDPSALFLDSTGADSYPSSLSLMSSVSASNPRFEGSDVALYIAVTGGVGHTLKNISKSTSIPLDTSEPTVDIGESLTQDGVSFFVYQVTGLTAGEVYEVDIATAEQVYAWPTDIERNKQSIVRIDAELEHALLNLSDEVVQVFENEVSVTEETNPSVVPSEYNNSLSGSGTQHVFYEPNENAGSGGVRVSQDIKDNVGDQARRKLVYFEEGQTFANQTYLSATDGVSTFDMIRYVNGVFNAQVFVPAIPEGTSTSTLYPAPPTLVSGSGIWINVPTLVIRNGIPAPEADEIFFTRNVPTQSTTLNIEYRGHANGNVFGLSSTTLANVGGTQEVATTFTLDDGGEQAFVEVRYYPSTRRIRVSVTESIRTGLPTINDIEVILSYTETRDVPATPATVRSVEIDSAGTRPYVFAIKPSSTGNLILVGREREIDTGYSYTTLFGASESGSMAVVGEGSRFLNYEDFEPIASTMLDLENHASLPQYGLFTTQYTNETNLNIGVTIKPSGLNVSDLPTSATGLGSGDVWFDGSSLKFVP